MIEMPERLPHLDLLTKSGDSSDVWTRTKQV